jgi:hypothetical protein
MAREIPEVVRAAAGLAATVLDEARKLPEMLPALPVRIIGLAMQQAMKLQQQYAGLVARGDELFTGVRGENEPGLATFDDDEPTVSPGFRDSAFDRAGTDDVDEARESIEEFAGEGPSTDEILDDLAIEDTAGDAPPAAEPTADVATPVEALPPAMEALPPAVEALPPAGEVTSVDDDVAPAEENGTTEQAGVTAGRPSPEAMAAGARAAEAAPIVVHEGEEVVDDAIGGGASPSESGAAVQADDSVTVVEEGSAPAAVTGPGVTAPVEGYDDFSIAQLRGRLRGYAPTTVEILISYEQANRARDPYLRMLRNRLERLQADNS